MRQLPVLLLLLSLTTCATDPVPPEAPPPAGRAELLARAAEAVARGPSPIGEQILGTGGEAALPWLRELAESPDEETRRRAQSLRLLAGDGASFTADERVSVWLEDLCREEPSPYAALLAVERLRGMGEAALPRLRAAAAGNDATAAVARRLLRRLEGLP